MRWSATLFDVLVDELNVSEELSDLLGEPKSLPISRYPQAVAVALALRYSWREDLLRNSSDVCDPVPEPRNDIAGGGERDTQTRR